MDNLTSPFHAISRPPSHAGSRLPRTRTLEFSEALIMMHPRPQARTAHQRSSIVGQLRSPFIADRHIYLYNITYRPERRTASKRPKPCLATGSLRSPAEGGTPAPTPPPEGANSIRGTAFSPPAAGDSGQRGGDNGDNLPFSKNIIS